MIIVAALLILREAWQAFQDPRTLDAPLEGLLINGFASALNARLVLVLISRGRRAALAGAGRGRASPAV